MSLNFLSSAINQQDIVLRRKFMKLILSIYDYSVMMLVKFHEDATRFREIIAL